MDRASLLQYIFTSQVSCLSGKFFTSRATRKAQNTGVGSLSLLQWIFPTQRLNQGPVYCRQILLPTELSGKLMHVCDSYTIFFSCLYHILAFNILLRDSLCFSVFSCLCVIPLIQSNISRGSVKTGVRAPSTYTLLRKCKNVNIVLDLHCYQLSHRNIHYCCLTLPAVANLEVMSM